MPPFEKTAFILLTILSAYLLKRTKAFAEKDAQVFINFVLYFALPATVFKTFKEVSLSKELVFIPLLAWAVIGLSALSAYFIGKALSLGQKSFRSFLLVSTFGNTAFLGYPYAYALFGEEGLTYAVLYDQLGSFTAVVSFGFWMATGSAQIKTLLTFPPFLALVGALFLRNFPFPPFVDFFLKEVSASLIPVILFSLGLRLRPSSLKTNKKALVAALFVKMFLSPLYALLLGKLLGLEGLPYEVALVESAMPPMVFAGVLAVRYRLDEELAFSAILWGLFLSFITVPLWLSLL